MIDWLRSNGYIVGRRARSGARPLREAMGGKKWDVMQIPTKTSQDTIETAIQRCLPPLKGLSMMEKFVVLMTHQGASQKDISKVARLTESRISQLVKSSIRKLRHNLDIGERESAKKRLALAFRRNYPIPCSTDIFVRLAEVTPIDRTNRNKEVSMRKSKSEHLPTHPEWLSRGLSAREADVAHLVAQGLSNREIADQLCVTEKTVKFHMTRIMSRLGAKRRGQVIVMAHSFSLSERGAA